MASIKGIGHPGGKMKPAGIEYLDIRSGKVYTQRDTPVGRRWTENDLDISDDAGGTFSGGTVTGNVEFDGNSFFSSDVNFGGTNIVFNSLNNSFPDGGFTTFDGEVDFNSLTEFSAQADFSGATNIYGSASFYNDVFINSGIEGNTANFNSISVGEINTNVGFGSNTTATFSGETVFIGDALFQGLASFNGLEIGDFNCTGEAIFNTLDSAEIRFFRFRPNYRAVTSTTTATTTDYTIHVTSGTFTVHLPDCTTVGTDSRVLVVKNTGSGTTTVRGFGSQLIDSGNTLSLTQYNKVTVQNTGTMWIVI